MYLNNSRELRQWTTVLQHSLSGCASIMTIKHFISPGCLSTSLTKCFSEPLKIYCEMIVPKNSLGISAWPRINILLVCAILVLVEICDILSDWWIPQNKL